MVEAEGKGSQEYEEKEVKEVKNRQGSQTAVESSLEMKTDKENQL